MSTAEQPATPALTRKQLRDIRNTGATPIVSGDAPPEHEPPTDEAAPESETQESATETEESEPVPAHDSLDEPAAVDEHDSVDEPDPADEHDSVDEHEAEAAPELVTPVAPTAPLPRAAVPVAVHDLPGADASVDLGVAPLTRRQARQQELIRTASVPVITPEIAAAHAASVEHEREHSEPEPDHTDTEPEHTDTEPEHTEPEAVESEDTEPGAVDLVFAEVAKESSNADEEDDRAIVNPRFGAELLAGEAAGLDRAPSFDQILSRSATGSVGTGNALILEQTPSASPLVAPVTATGEVLITGTFNLPEGLGSTGHAHGTADSKETDAVLIDGELPAHSSPTPIAASAAISTVKNGADIIKPPTPEKGGRLMLTLAITAGVLALALVGVLILAFVTGVF